MGILLYFMKYYKFKENRKDIDVKGWNIYIPNCV